MSIPVLGGLGGGPWLDGRVRAVYKLLDEAVAGYAEDVRAARPVIGRLMPTATCDGIETRYEVTGSGPPLLLFSPGGFNATVENWTSFGIYARLDLLDAPGGALHLHRLRQARVGPLRRPASSRSAGRTTRAQGAGLLDHLGIERAHLLGGCIGCSIALAFADAWPERVERMVLYSPAGGPRYRITQRARFAEHLAYVEEHGLAGVVELAGNGAETFAQDPRRRPVGERAPPRPGVRRRVRETRPGALPHARRRDWSAALRPRHRPRPGRPSG